MKVFWKVIALYYGNQTKHRSTWCDQNQEFSKGKSGGNYCYHCALKTSPNLKTRLSPNLKTTPESTFGGFFSIDRHMLKRRASDMPVVPALK
jgi:hypothetical protein